MNPTPKQIERKWIEILHKVLGDELKDYSKHEVKIIAGVMLTMMPEEKRGKFETRIKRAWKRAKEAGWDKP